MLTPRFTLSQDDNCVTLSIRAPYAKISEAEIEICDNEFHFYSKPYHLRLYFSNDLTEDGLSSKYDSGEGTFKICIIKKVSGTHFPDLDMITKLLTPPGKWKVPKVITENSTDASTASTADKDSDTILSETFDWTIPQTGSNEVVRCAAGPLNGEHMPHKYGFALTKEGVFSCLTSELGCVIDIEDVDNMSSECVRAKRVELEKAAFDEDHYLADLFHDEEVRELLSFDPWWIADQSGVLPEQPNHHKESHHFDEVELDVLKELPRLPIEVDPAALLSTFCSLAEFIFGYAYDMRTNLGSHTVESSWTISKLSPTLSCLDALPSAKETVTACARRSVIYPLYRNFQLTSKVFTDVVRIFGLGRWAVLKCLLAIWKLFSNNLDNRYILNDLYVTSYCVWIQNIDEERVKEFTIELEKVTLVKADLDLDLELTERAADLAVEEERVAGPDAVKGAPVVRNLEEVMAEMRVADSDDSDG